MVAVPAVPPVTTPVVEFTVADVELLLHVPPAVASVSVIVAPTHTAVGPVMAVGAGVIVMVLVARQPVPSE